MNKTVAALLAVIVLLIAALAFMIGHRQGAAASSEVEGVVSDEAVKVEQVEEPSEASAPMQQAGGSAGQSESNPIEKSVASGQLIDGCYHLDSCSFSRIVRQTTLVSSASERLIEASLLDSVERSVRSAPKERDLVWERQPRKIYAVCSPRRPTLIFEYQGAWLAEEFDLTDVPGVVQNNANTYQALCHGAFANEVANDPARYGYTPLQDGGRGQFNVSSPKSYFSQG